MKPKELFYLLGLKPKPVAYGYQTRTFSLEKDGTIQYAQWLHPYEREKTIRQSAIDEIRKFLKDGDVAIDIGAHTGDSTIPIALAVGASGCVLALEPNSYVFPILQKNAEFNQDRTKIIPLCFAATPEDARVEFCYSDNGYCNGGSFSGISRLWHGHTFKLNVEGRNLPKLLESQFPDLISRVRYIKIDAEGYDLTIIDSLSGFLRNYRPYLKVEVYKRLNLAQRKALFRTLVALRYSVHKVEDDDHYVGETLRESDLLKWRHFDVFCIPRV